MYKGLGILLLVFTLAISALASALRNRENRKAWLKEAAVFSGVGLLIIGLLAEAAYLNHWPLPR